MRCGDKEPQFSCRFCGRMFYRKDNLESHIKVHKRKEQAQRRSRSSATSKDAQSEATTKQRNTKSQSVRAKSNSAGQSNPIDVHQCRRTGKYVYCTFCTRKFYHRSDLKKHLYLEHKVLEETILQLFSQKAI